jgi:alpha-L-fucosidase 2
MLLQSHGDAIEPLPAVPEHWSDGSVSGLQARGGFEVDITWSDHELDRMVVRSGAGGPCRLRIPEGATITRNGESIEGVESEEGVIVVPTEESDTITVLRD